jgi:hypothetical protein
MSSHTNKAANFLALAFALVIVAISSLTTFAFFTIFFPRLVPEAILAPDIGALVSGAVGVALFDLACVVWLILFLQHAETPEQRAISLIMVVVTFVGSALASVAYLGLTATGAMALDDQTAGTVGTFALVGVMLGVVANFGASQSYTRFSYANKIRVQESDMRDSFQDQETDQAKLLTELVSQEFKKEIAALAPGLAKAQATALATEFARKQRNRYAIPEETGPANGAQAKPLSKGAKEPIIVDYNGRSRPENFPYGDGN